MSLICFNGLGNN